MAFLFLLLPAGRGGEEKLKKCFAVDRSRGSRSFLAVLVFWRVAGWSPFRGRDFASEEDASSWLSRGGALIFNNKRLRQPRRPWLLPGDAVLVSLLSAGRGGEGEEGVSVAASRLCQDNLLLFRAQHMDDKIVAMICGCEDRRSSRRVDGAPSTSKSEALDRVLGWRYTPPSHQVVRPRLLVAGGRRRGSDEIIAGGEDLVLDCFSLFFAGSFLLTSKDQLVISFSQGPFCKMYPPLYIM